MYKTPIVVAGYESKLAETPPVFPEAVPAASNK